MNSFYNMLSDIAGKYSDNTAVLYDTFAVTYDTLFEDAKKKALQLSGLPGKRIALYGPSSYRWLVNFLGIILAGKDAVLVNFFLPKREKEKRISSVGCDYTLTSTNQYMISDLEETIIEKGHDAVQGEYVPDGAEGDVIIFTAHADKEFIPVVLTSANIMNTVNELGSYCGCDSTDRVLAQTPTHNIFGLVYSLLWPMNSGACVCIGRGIRHVNFDTVYYSPTIIAATPSMIDYLHRLGALNQELKKVVIGGTECNDDLLYELKAEGRDVFVIYGMAECSGIVAVDCGGTGKFQIYTDNKVWIDDGEIVVSGPCVMKGYDGSESEAKEFHTKDRGHLDEDGKLIIEGRNPGILYLGNGEKVSCKAVSAQISSLMP